MGWQIAIDGPAASGKSTIAKIIANQLNFCYLDTGAMYRAITLKALRLGINLSNEDEYTFLDATEIKFENDKIFLDDQDVTKEIRSIEVSNNVSLVSSFRTVRALMVKLQQEIAHSANIIMDGRDIGTVVLPNANLKVFLTASVPVRAKRRRDERIANGDNTLSLDETIKEIESRDYKDSNRQITPLCKADDAIEIDSSNLSVEEVIDIITSLVSERGYRMENLEKKNEVVEEATKDEVVEDATKDEVVEETTKDEVVEQLEEVKEEATPEEVKDETTPEEATSEEVKEEAVAEVKDEVTEEVTESATEEVTEEAKEDNAPKYKEMQLVKGTIIEVQGRREAKGSNQRAREERVLIELPDGQQGFLFKKDAAGVAEDEELLDVYVEGDEIDVVIKKIFPDGGKFIFSTLLVERRREIMKFDEDIKESRILTAKAVKMVPGFGLLLKYQDFACLLPTSLASVPENELESLINTEIEVVPIRIDAARIRLIVSQKKAISLKSRAEKSSFIETVEVGQIYDGVVKNIESYGAFIEISKGVEGLLHISEVEHTRVSKVEKVLNIGDTVKVQVIKIDKDHIGLSRKSLIPNKWAEYLENHKVDDVVSGKVSKIVEKGVNVELDEEIIAFIPKREFAWEKDTFIEDFVKIGDEVEAKIIETDLAKHRIILSKRQLTENPWESTEHKVGDIVSVTVLQPIKAGYKISLDNMIGFLHRASVDGDPDSLEVGSVVKAKIKILDLPRTKLNVSMRDATEKVEKESYGKYMKSQEKVSNTLGDFFKK